MPTQPVMQRRRMDGNGGAEAPPDGAALFGGLAGYVLTGEELRALALRCIGVVEGYGWLHATHPDDFFSADPWQHSGEGGASLRRAAESLSPDQCVRLPCVDEEAPTCIQDFVRNVDCAVPMRDTISFAPFSERESRQRKGYTPKKAHEVEQFREAMRLLLCHSKAAPDTRVLLNIGEGRGHLSEELAAALRGHISAVVGLDCQEALCAVSRQRASEAAAAADAGSSSVARHSIVCRVQPTMSPADFASLINSEASAEHRVGHNLQGTALLGLHACGDLSSTAVRLFCRSASPLLVVAPCCYHALTPAGFPLSDLFASREVSLSVVSRMLACVPVDRWGKSHPESQLAKHRLGFFRAVVGKALAPARLEVPPSAYRKVAKVPCLSLGAFLDAVLPAAGKDTPEVREAAGLLDTPARFQEYLAFVSLRKCVAEALETALLVDRWLFLSARSRVCAALPLFDPTISPRRFVLVAAGHLSEEGGVAEDGGGSGGGDPSPEEDAEEGKKELP